MTKYRIHGVMAETVAYENPLTEENLRIFDNVMEKAAKEKLSPPYKAGAAYEALRNSLAIANSRYSNDLILGFLVDANRWAWDNLNSQSYILEAEKIEDALEGRLEALAGNLE